MAKFEKRMRARTLRRDGWSIRSIATHLNVSKASASIWCNDLQLTTEQRERLYTNAQRAGLVGRLKGAETNRKRKEERIKYYQTIGAHDFHDLTKRELFITGVALYWAEGNRKSRLGFINSDPAMIQLMYRWFKEIMEVPEQDFMPRIFINAIHKPRINTVMAFWSRLLHLPLSQFGNPVFIKRVPRKMYENYDQYHGLLAIHTRRSTELKYRILGLIDALRIYADVA